MKNIILSARVLAAAKVFQAKNDHRKYICGTHINEVGIYSTNGHVAFLMNHPEGLKCIQGDGYERPDGPLTIDIMGAIPKAANIALLTFIDDGEGFIRYVNSKGFEIDKKSFFKVVDDGFPCIRKALEKYKDSPVESINVNPGYLSSISKCINEISGVRHHGCEMSFTGSNGVIKIAHRSALEKDAEIYIMPMRG